jgi:putative ABC transport system permease protein
MRPLRAWVMRVTGFFRREGGEQELADELQAHLEMRIADNLRAGMSEAEARRAALIDSGGLESAKEAWRDRRGLPWAENFWLDLRYAVRTLGRSPGFTLTAVLTLALGIGANTAIFSVVNAAMLQRMPFESPDRLALVWERSPNGDKANVVNPLNFLDWRDRNHSFERMAAWFQFGASLTGDGEPEQIDSMIVSDGFFQMLGVRPVLGRWFTPEENLPNAPDVVIVSWELWQRRFGGDAGILGRNLQINHRPQTVVGVMPAGFRFPQTRADFWMPYGLARSNANQDGRYLSTLARLRPGVSLAAARADMNVLASQLQKEHPQLDTKWGATVVGLREQAIGGVRTPLLVLLAAVGLVLLIACANVANLMLMRAAGRGREIAIRGALGAGGWRIARQLLVESILIGALGGTAGLLMGIGAMRALTAALPDTITYSTIKEIRIDTTVLLFATAASVVTGILFGLAPAWKAARTDLQQALRDGGRGIAGRRSPMRNTLVVAEVALSMMLLAGAGLLIRSFARLAGVTPGFDARHVLSMQLSERGRFKDNPAMLEFNTEMLERVRRIPGVEAAGTSHFLPLGRIIPATGYWRADHPAPKPGDAPVTEVLCVMPGYFAAMSIPLERGRVFGERDRAGAPLTVVVNAAAARGMFPGEDALGKRLYIQWGRPDDTYEIVGVVGDVRQQSLDREASPGVYLPTLQAPTTPVFLVARTHGDARQLAGTIQAAIHAMDRNIPISDVRTMDAYVSESVSAPRFLAILLGGFAALAMLLAAVGIFGVISYAVAHRTQEIGVRRALGAGTAGVMRLVLAQGLSLTAAGVVLGTGGALAITRLLRSMLFGITPTDALTFASVAGVLTAAAFLASYLPARRAARIDPMHALRYE